MKKLLPFLLPVLLVACGGNDNPDHDDSLKNSGTGIPAPASIGYTIVATHPHDTSAYTQGLELHEGKMFESTGDYENSSVRITDHKTGAISFKHVMGSKDIFGEGITIFNNKLYQLTWQNNIVYVYDLKNLNAPATTLKWNSEGWGITHDSTRLIVSDGSNILYFVKPEDFSVLSTISVRDNRGSVYDLNELEYIEGFIYANIYTTGDIVKIDPESGNVVGKISFKNLLTQQDVTRGRTDVLNGIAYDSTTKTMFITGKRWPKLFEVKLQ